MFEGGHIAEINRSSLLNGVALCAKAALPTLSNKSTLCVVAVPAESAVDTHHDRDRHPRAPRRAGPLGCALLPVEIERTASFRMSVPRRDAQRVRAGAY